MLLVDDRDRTLLFSSVSEDDGGTFWYPPGGGVEAGETHEEAALREVREETGLVLADVGRPFARRTDVRTLGGTTYEFVEVWFLVRIASFDIDTSGFTDLERTTIGAHRWWTTGELRGTADRLTPTALPDLLDRLLAEGTPAQPWTLAR